MADDEPTFGRAKSQGRSWSEMEDIFRHMMEQGEPGMSGKLTHDMVYDMMRRMRGGFRDEFFSSGFREETEEEQQAREQLLRFEVMLQHLGPEKILRFMVNTLAEMGDLEEILTITVSMAQDQLRKESRLRRERNVYTAREDSPTGRMPSYATIDDADSYFNGVRFGIMNDVDFAALEERVGGLKNIKNANDFRKSKRAPQTPRSPRRSR